MSLKDFIDHLAMYTTGALPDDRGEYENRNVVRLEATTVEWQCLDTLQLMLTRSHDAQGAQARVVVWCDHDGLEKASAFVHDTFAFAWL